MVVCDLVIKSDRRALRACLEPTAGHGNLRKRASHARAFEPPQIMAEALQNKLPLQRRHAFKGARHREFIGSLGYAIHLRIVDRHRGLLFEPLPPTTMCCEV